MPKNLKTTIAGIATIIAALGGAAAMLLDGNDSTIPDWTGVAAAIVAGVGLIFARDFNITSEGTRTPKPPEPPTNS